MKRNRWACSRDVFLIYLFGTVVLGLGILMAYHYATNPILQMKEGVLLPIPVFILSGIILLKEGYAIQKSRTKRT